MSYRNYALVAMALYGFVGCSSELPAPSEGELPSAGSVENSAPPTVRQQEARSKIDARVKRRFEQVHRQVVVVSVADPFGEQRIDGSVPIEPAPERRQARIAKRRTDLAERKARVVQRLRTANVEQLTVTRWYPAFRMFAVEATAEHVAALEQLADVQAVHFNTVAYPTLTETLPFIDAPWFHQNIGSGAATSVAVLDSPIRYENGHFGACPQAGAPGCKVLVRQSFASETCQQIMAKEDEYLKGSHGSHVGGIVLGVAPDSALLSLNIFNSDDKNQGLGATTAAQIDALNWVADHSATYDIVAVNMSIGSLRTDPMPCNDAAIYDAVRTLLHDYDIVTVIGAGNDYQPNAMASPGCISLAVTVGAQADNDWYYYNIPPGGLLDFSNRNGMMDLVAPGKNITAGGYHGSGTSMATPVVAGAVASWQSYYIAQLGSPYPGNWMRRLLVANSSAPLPDSNYYGSRLYSQLKLKEKFNFDHVQGFASWYREAPANAIPSSSPGFQQTMTVSGKGWDIASAYLQLEVVHPYPENVEVTVQSPSGATSTVVLPAGQANFNGIIGRMIYPGAFAALAGSAVDGTWTISVRDTQQADQGNYLQAVLYFVKEGCVPDCIGSGCGDDRCGGSCGDICSIDGSCYVFGETDPQDPCFGCQPNASTYQWSALSGTSCNDGNSCTENDVCSAGNCSGTPVTCPVGDLCYAVGTCQPATGQCVYPMQADGTGCDDGVGCTQDDQCVQGICQGTQSCPESPPCHSPGNCDLGLGECAFDPVADGTPCATGVCFAGQCVDPPDDEPQPGQGGQGPTDVNPTTDPAPKRKTTEESSGCAVAHAGEGSSRSGYAIAVLFAALGWSRRRRRRV